MEIQRVKKTKQQQVWEILDRDGYISDSDTAKIFGHERLWCVCEHVRKWKSLKRDQVFFADKQIVEKVKGHRQHLVRLKDQESWYRVCKEFWQTVEV